MMKIKNLLGLAIMALCLASCSKEPAKPILSGEIWPDNEGVHVNAHGGGVLYHVIICRLFQHGSLALRREER